MERIVDFYYGIGSRYSYLASTQIAGLERDTGCRVRWRPFYSKDLMAARRMDPFIGPPPSGQYETPYRSTDAARWAAFYGIPYKEPDWPALDWRRYALAAVAADRLGACVAFSRQLFNAVFGAGTAPTDDAAFARLAEQAGLSGQRLVEMIDASETATQHQQTMAEAIAAGVFGVPSFVTDGAMFWGNDRLGLLRHHLGASR
jgi:2-hydroxychromene-2-carboxylate isomerase